MIRLCAKLLAQCILFGPVCVFVGLRVRVFVGLDNSRQEPEAITAWVGLLPR